MGFLYVVHNFNHERLLIAVGACRQARMCYEMAFEEALKRETFGKPLIKHQLIRFKLAEMSRQVESLYSLVENVAYQFKSGVKDFSLGSFRQLRGLKLSQQMSIKYVWLCCQVTAVDSEFVVVLYCRSTMRTAQGAGQQSV